MVVECYSYGLYGDPDTQAFVDTALTNLLAFQAATDTHAQIFGASTITLAGCCDAITGTAGHPIFSIDRAAYVDLGDLMPGERVRTADGWASVEAMSRWRGQQEVYNLEVDGEHRFFVGEVGVESHNAGPCHARDFDSARRQAFEKAGMTDPAQIRFSKVDPKTGTVVEFKGPGGAKVAYDAPHANRDAALGHDKPHVGWQTAGKRSSGGSARGNITYDGPQHPSRSSDPSEKPGR